METKHTPGPQELDKIRTKIQQFGAATLEQDKNQWKPANKFFLLNDLPSLKTGKG